jgi:aldehyde dehydrogenase (NAD+)
MSIPFTQPKGLFVANRWIATDAHEDVINPATEAVIGVAPVGDAGAADLAIAAARAAFDDGPWSRLHRDARADIMQRLHAALVARKDQIRALLIAEVGCSQGIVDMVQVGACLDHFQSAITVARRDDSYHLPNETIANPADPAGSRILGGAIVVREPIGVVAGITAYNFPFLLNLSKIVPALLAGNTLILKPSPYTPFSALLFGDLALEVGLPEGVLNIVTGGGDVGALLTSDPRVDMVSFTGSEGVGAAIMAQASATLKRVHLELGGKSAMIVRSDADIQQAAIAAVGGLTVNCGQGCALMTRYLVHNSVRPAFAATMKAVADHWKIGDPIDPSVLMGPLIREAQRQKVERLVQSGVDSGATLIRGGGRVPGLDRGFFYDITLFDDVDNRSELAQEEVFGPVGVITGFDTDEEAVRLANDSRFGLSGSIWSADAATAYEMSLQIRTGSVHINGGMGKMAFAPLGGFKRSGIGREYGPEWLKEFTQEKTLFYPLGR